MCETLFTVGIVVNIKRFQIPDGEIFALNAVMVWIHGGAFSCGCASTTTFGPQYIVENDVVLVTLNYRIGPLGSTQNTLE
jgi:carboxylesterase type B